MPIYSYQYISIYQIIDQENCVPCNLKNANLAEDKDTQKNNANPGINNLKMN